jgi:hypothetical protein
VILASGTCRTSYSRTVEKGLADLVRIRINSKESLSSPNHRLSKDFRLIAGSIGMRMREIRFKASVKIIVKENPQAMWIAAGGKMKPIWLCWFALVLLGNCFAREARGIIDEPIRTGKPGKVIGRVTDDGRSISHASVKIANRHFSMETKTDEEGRYEIKIPAGVYWITLQADDYFPYRRAALRIAPGETKPLNISPKLRVLGVVAYIDKKTEVYTHREDLAPPIKYDLLPARGIANGVSKVMVQFTGKRRVGNSTEYDSVSVTYDVVTVVADRVFWNDKKRTLEADGNIRLESSANETYPRHISIKLGGKRPTLIASEGSIDSVKGQGSINGGKTGFEVSVNREREGNLNYQNTARGVAFAAHRIDSFRVIDDKRRTVTFSGSGVLTGDVPKHLSYRGGVPVLFWVTVTPKSRSYPGHISFSFGLTQFDDSGDIFGGNVDIHREAEKR